MKKKNNVLAIVLLVAIVLVIGYFASSKSPKGVADDQAAAAHSATVYCSDSDGGVNLAVQGTARTYTIARNGSQSTISSSTDTCTNSTTVTEYACTSNVITSTQGACSTGTTCVNGACVASTGGTDLCPNIAGIQTTVPAGMMIDASGNCVSAGADTTPPTVSMYYPAAGAQICSTSNFSFVANVDDNNFPTPTSGTTFYLDNNLLSTKVTQVPSYPHQYQSASQTGTLWGVSTGTHTVYSKACDAANNCTTSAPASFSITSCKAG